MTPERWQRIESLEGQTLAAKINGRPLDSTQIIEIAAQVDMAVIFTGLEKGGTLSYGWKRPMNSAMVGWPVGSKWIPGLTAFVQTRDSQTYFDASGSRSDPLE